jgi:hypothetical protein
MTPDCSHCKDKNNRKILNIALDIVKYMFTTWEYKKEPEKYLEKSANGEKTIQTTRMHIKN